MPTTLFQNGRVVDGTGARAFDGHVVIDGSRITAVLPAGEPPPPADTVIDADGKIIAPGFIDMHSHADWLLPNAGNAEILTSLLEQGVTTVVAGNCGVSPAPLRKETVERIETLASIFVEEPLDYEWTSMAEFFDRMERAGPLVNVAQLVGHTAIRYALAETERGAMRYDEVRSCIRAVRQCLDDGACGLSFGLGYDPGMYSSLAELSAFAAATAASGKMLTVHLKAFSRISPCYPVTYLRPHNVRALREMLDVARATGVRLQLSHFIFVGRRTWETAEECLRLVDDARREGVDVMIDAFPFTAGNTTVDAILPYWFLASVPGAYHSPLALARLRVESEVGFRLVGFDLGDLQLMNPGVPGWEDLCGLRLPEIARRWGTSSFSAMLELSERSAGAALMLLHTYSGEPGDEQTLDEVLRRDDCLFETDAVCRTAGYPNPAAVGTFPRILGRYVREQRMIGLESAVRRMSGASAARFGLSDRGVLAAGKAADVVVFDPRTISDSPPRGDGPARRPVGIEHVFVNGVHAVEGGIARTTPRAGQVLRT